MGCFASKAQDTSGNTVNIGEVAVFVPGLRIPKPVDFSAAFAGKLSKSMIGRLSFLRTRIVVMAGEVRPSIKRTKRKSSAQYGAAALADLQQALEEYLPVLLGLVKDGNRTEHELSYAWVNHETDAEEHDMASAWYEILSVLHLMAMLLFCHANTLLLPRTPIDRYQPKVSEESKRTSVDIFLKAAGYLDCAIRNVLPCLPPDIRRNLPFGLTEGVLQALCLQALGQAVDIQLGMAIYSAKATLAVKRRLACEMVKYWQQEPDLVQRNEWLYLGRTILKHFSLMHHPVVAPDLNSIIKPFALVSKALDNIKNLLLANGWGQKHQLFIKWKLIEAKAAAYYFHGQILDEGNTKKSQGMAVAALQTAYDYLKESNKACERFNASSPLSKTPPPWGTMKYMSENIPKDALSKLPISRDSTIAPALPDFVLALKPDDYSLPPVHPSWNVEAIELSNPGAPRI